MFFCTVKSKGIFSYQFSMLEKLAFGHFLLMISKLARETNKSKKQRIFSYQFITFEKLAWTFSILIFKACKESKGNFSPIFRISRTTKSTGIFSSNFQYLKNYFLDIFVWFRHLQILQTIFSAFWIKKQGDIFLPIFSNWKFSFETYSSDFKAC